MLSFIAALYFLSHAHAILMEPTFQAAETLGYQIVGEVEFGKESHQPQSAQMERQFEEIGELCPRTQALDPNISSFARFVILAWADKDFPTRARQFHTAHQQWLAHQRAKVIAEKIRRGVKGQLHFELVNMAHRKPHWVPSIEADQRNGKRYDVKEVLESAGAAPSDALGFGLFAEYSQAAKAVVWVECKETLVRPPHTTPNLVRLAWNGAKKQIETGHL